MASCFSLIGRNAATRTKKQLFQRSPFIFCQQSYKNNQNYQTRRSNFSFAGPRKLDEILKTELIKDKSKAEVTDIWMTYHEEKESVFGSVIPSKNGDQILKRAQECPFFVQPIFREGGFFTLISQFQAPSHFFLAYLEDFKMDPNRAQPLVTCSMFSELSETLGIHLLRCDVINKGLEDIEGFKATESILEMYTKDEEYEKVKTFNQQPDSFDFDDFISCQNQKWKDSFASDNTTN